MKKVPGRSFTHLDNADVFYQRRLECLYQAIIAMESIKLSLTTGEESDFEFFENRSDDEVLDFVGYVKLAHGEEAMHLILTFVPLRKRRLIELAWMLDKNAFTVNHLLDDGANSTEENNDLFEGKYETRQ